MFKHRQFQKTITDYRFRCGESLYEFVVTRKDHDGRIAITSTPAVEIPEPETLSPVERLLFGAVRV